MKHKISMPNELFKKKNNIEKPLALLIMIPIIYLLITCIYGPLFYGSFIELHFLFYVVEGEAHDSS